MRTGLAQVIDQVATPQCSWTTFLEQSASLWLDKDSPLAMPVDRFVSEFIGPDMMWQRDWATSLQELDTLPHGSHLPGRVRKRLAWQAFAEFTYLSRRGRNLDAIGKATLAPRLEDIERAADALLPVLHEKFGIRHADRENVVQWLWGFVCHLRQRGAVATPELMAYALTAMFLPLPARRDGASGCPAWANAHRDRCFSRWGKNAGLTIW